MRPCALIVLAGLLAAGCASIAPPPDTARLPPNAYGLFADNDIGAINLAQWAFADPARTRNDPADAARAAAAVDYLAGELSSSPRWIAMSPITKGQMLQAREEVRRALGVAPGAPSQLVVDGLLGRRTRSRRGTGPGHSPRSARRCSPGRRNRRSPGYRTCRSCRSPTSPASARRSSDFPRMTASVRCAVERRERHRFAVDNTLRKRHCEPPLGGVAIQTATRMWALWIATPLRGSR